MRKWIHEHSLGITLISIYVVLKVASIFVTEDQPFWFATLHGHSDDAFGAILIVLLTKWLVERGKHPSHESD